MKTSRVMIISSVCMLFIISGCRMFEQKEDNVAKLKEMFSLMVEKKDASLIPAYYHKDFLLYSNGITMDYQELLDSHVEIYQTAIQYKVAYDEQTLLQEGDKVAGRVFITTSRPDEKPKEIEVMLIAQYKEGKLYRVWELTWPDWSKMPAFQDMV